MSVRFPQVYRTEPQANVLTHGFFRSRSVGGPGSPSPLRRTQALEKNRSYRETQLSDRLKRDATEGQPVRS